MISVAHVLPDGTVKESFEMADGMTLEQAARTICPDSGGKFPAPVIAIVGSKPAVRELGDWDYPLADGALVQFRQLALGGGGGGGSNPLQMVLQIAIIALAVAASVFTAGSSLFAAGGALAGMGGLFGGLAGAGVMILGTMLMGQLFPQSLPQGQLSANAAAAASPTYSINASGNQARLYQPEPEGFGRMKIVPDFVANTWTQYVGNDQIGYFVYGIGRGRYEVESLQFGESVFWRDGELVEGSPYEIQDIQFVEPGQAVTIFPDNVIASDEVNGQELFAPNDAEYDGVIGPYTTNSPGTKTNKLLFDFVLQTGLGHYNDQGDLENYSVSWKIEYRAVDDFGNPGSEWAVLDTPSMTAATLTPQRLTKTYDVAEGRYQARVVRTSNTTGDGRTLDTLVWGAMRAILPGTYAYPISCIAFSIKASNALTQNASTRFSVIATRKLPLYDRATKTWSDETPTRSWAAAVAHVCKCEWGGRVSDANIDLDALWTIDEKLQARGWQYDAYIDGAYLVWPLLVEMCQSQCVIPRFVGPVLSFVMDAADRPPVFALTPRNIVRNSFSVTYATWSDETPDDVTVEYLDADYGYQQRDVTATLPESESREPSGLNILGITSREHAHKVAVAYAAHNRWQRVIVECQVEALGRVINRGDVCTVAHPRFRNTAAGAVASWDEGGLEISLKRDMGRTGADTDEGDGYIALTRQDGSIWGPCKLAALEDSTAVLDSADYATLLLQGQGNPFEWLTSGMDRLPTTWTLYASRVYQRLMVVDSVTTQDFLHYSLKLLNYDDRIYQYGDMETPPWQGRGQLPVVETLDAPENLRGVIKAPETVTLVWMSVPGASWYEVETSATGESWVNLGRSNVTQMTVTVAPGVIYARVRAASDTLQSGWAMWEGDTSIPVPATPRLVLEGEYVGGDATLFWPPVEHAEKYAVALKSGGQVVYTSAVESGPFVVTPEMQEGGPFRELECMVSAVGAAGSSPEATVALSDPAPVAPVDAEVVIGASGVTLESVTPDEAPDKTGYVIVRGDAPGFTAAQAAELRQTAALPYVWDGLAAGTYYFRVVVKDAFFDLARNPLSLNWSPVLAVEISGGGDGQ